MTTQGPFSRAVGCGQWSRPIRRPRPFPSAGGRALPARPATSPRRGRTGGPRRPRRTTRRPGARRGGLRRPCMIASIAAGSRCTGAVPAPPRRGRRRRRFGALPTIPSNRACNGPFLLTQHGCLQCLAVDVHLPPSQGHQEVSPSLRQRTRTASHPQGFLPTDASSAAQVSRRSGSCSTSAPKWPRHRSDERPANPHPSVRLDTRPILAPQEDFALTVADAMARAGRMSLVAEFTNSTRSRMTSHPARGVQGIF